MPTFIGYNYDNKPISIVVSKSKELAYAFWQGKELGINSHKCVETDFTSIDEHPTGVFPILTTIEVSALNYSNAPLGAKILTILK